MKKKYLKLTKGQKERGVVFSSEFVGTSNPIIPEITSRECKEDYNEAMAKMERLKDDRFFRGWGEDRNNKIIHDVRS